MPAVTKGDAFQALQTTMMDAEESIHTDYTPIGSPSFEGSPSTVAGRSVKVYDLNGSTQWMTYDASAVQDWDSGVVAMFIKPDFIETSPNAACLWDGRFIGGPDDEIRMGEFVIASDDWRYIIRENGTNVIVEISTGLSWSVDDIISVVFLWERTGGLDGGESGAMYWNKSKEASSSVTYGPGEMQSEWFLGSRFNGGVPFDGGIVAMAGYSYSSLNGKGYSDEDIVQFCHLNALGQDGAHAFPWELETLAKPWYYYGQQ